MDTWADELRRAVAAVDRAGLRTPTAVLLEMLAPLDVINSAIARFSLPLLTGTAAGPLASALADAATWPELRRLLADPSLEG
ncbi:MAG: hypothetical protein OHK0015_15880 [Chloroflexi bacterium OHK40]